MSPAKLIYCLIIALLLFHPVCLAKKAKNKRVYIKQGESDKYLLKEGIIKYDITFGELPVTKGQKQVTRKVEVRFSDSGMHKVIAGEYLTHIGIARIERVNGAYTTYYTDGRSRTGSPMYNIITERYSVGNIFVATEFKAKYKLDDRKIKCATYMLNTVGRTTVDGEQTWLREGPFFLYKNITVSAIGNYNEKYWVKLSATEIIEK